MITWKYIKLLWKSTPLFVDVSPEMALRKELKTMIKIIVWVSDAANLQHRISLNRFLDTVFISMKKYWKKKLHSMVQDFRKEVCSEGDLGDAQKCSSIQLGLEFSKNTYKMEERTIQDESMSWCLAIRRTRGFLENWLQQKPALSALCRGRNVGEEWPGRGGGKCGNS